MAAKRTISPTLRKYNALRRKKKSFCAGRATKADVIRVSKAYVSAAVAKGQSKTEAEKKARAVLNAGCKISTRVAGTKGKKRKATRKKITARKVTRRRRRA